MIIDMCPGIFNVDFDLFRIKNLIHNIWDFNLKIKLAEVSWTELLLCWLHLSCVPAAVCPSMPMRWLFHHLIPYIPYKYQSAAIMWQMNEPLCNTWSLLFLEALCSSSLRRVSIGGLPFVMFLFPYWAQWPGSSGWDKPFICFSKEMLEGFH